MCQYDRRCATGHHMPFTQCPYAGRGRRQGGNRGASLAVGLTALCAAAYFGSSNLPNPSEIFDGSPSPRPHSNQVKIVRVVDGDTIGVHLDGSDDVRVRLLGIDSPEVGRDGEPGECFGTRATRELEKLTPVGSRVVLTSDSSQDDTDRWGRLLRYVELDGVDINEELLRRGAAERFLNRPPLERTKPYNQAEAKAKKTQAGLWGSC